MKSIWYFVGIIVSLIGGILLLTGLYYLINPPLETKILSDLHPNIWWGSIMLIIGSIFYFKNNGKSSI